VGQSRDVVSEGKPQSEPSTTSQLLQTGDSVFVRTNEDDTFFVGTIEGVVDAGYLVSYPPENNGRRSDPEFVTFRSVVAPSAIAAGPPVDDAHPTRLPAGARYVCGGSAKTFRLVECLEAVDLAQTDEVPAQPLAVDQTGNVSANTSPPMRIDTKRAFYRPAYLGELRRLQYLAPVDPLIDVYAAPVFEHWTWRGRARATFANMTIEGDLVLKVRGRRIKTRFTYPRESAMRLTTAMLEGMGEGVLEPLEPGDSDHPCLETWRAERVLFRGGGYSISVREVGPQYSRASFFVPILDVTFDSSMTPNIIREVYEGAAFRACTDYILKRMPAVVPPIFRANDAIRVDLFGRPATLYSPSRDERFEGVDVPERIGVVYVGEQLEAVEFEALSTLLGYLAGGRLSHLSTEQFIPARRLSCQRVNRGKATKRFTLPLPTGVFDRPLAPTVMSQFGSMLRNLHTAITRNPKGTASAFHHYAEARSHTYPTTSVVLMSVAIDALISLMTGDSQSNATLMAAEKFDLIEPRLQQVLDRAFADEPDLSNMGHQHERLARKIREGLNTVSNTKRLERFWVDLCGIKLTKDELALLGTRHIALHEGHLGGDERDVTTLRENYVKATRLANMFNRGVLASLLRYEGPVLDATDGKSYIRIANGLPHAASGDEAIPTAELRIEFSATVLSTDDRDESGDG